MKFLKFIAVFFFLIFGVGNAFAYNQFAGIDDGKLCLSLRAFGQKTTTQIKPQETLTTFYSAKVTVKSDSYVESGATGAAILSGYFYNENRGPGSGQEYNGVEGNVWLDIRIALNENNTLRVEGSASRTLDADGNLEDIFFEENFITSIAFDTEYTLSIEVAYPKVYFKCDDEVLSYDLTSPIYLANLANWDDRRLMSRIYAGEGQGGYFSATFDDVCINNKINLYDDFNNGLVLDASKWDVDLKVDWWYIQHRKKENGTAFNRPLLWFVLQ